MTDKTDIAALRDRHELALKDLTERLTECNRLNFCMDELSAFAAFSSTVIDQLEAERQQREAAESELAAIRGEQEPVAYFAAAPDYGWDIFKNKEDAIATCQEEIDSYRECRDDGWDDDVERVCWGIVIQKAEGFDAQGLHSSNAQHTYQTCDYKLHPAAFSSQPKPVVVLSDCTFEAVSHMAHWYTEGECVAFVSGVEHAKKQMLAAGIVVKDGE